MADMLQTLSVISFVVAGVLLLVAAFMWFLLGIPKVISDLSGRTARKSIEKTRTTNEKNAQNAYKMGGLNYDGLEGADGNASSVEDTPGTGLMTENIAKELPEATTTLLNEKPETAPLVAEEYKPRTREGGKKLEMIDDVVLIHTDEVI